MIFSRTYSVSFNFVGLCFVEDQKDVKSHHIHDHGHPFLLCSRSACKYIHFYYPQQIHIMFNTLIVYNFYTSSPDLLSLITIKCYFS